MPKEMPHTTNIEPPAHNKEKLPFEGEDDHNEDVATRAGGGEAESTANSDNNVHVAAGGTTRHDEPVTNTTADQRGEDTPEDGSQSSGTAGGMWDSMAETTAPIPLPGGKEPASSPRKAMASPFRSKWKGAVEKELQSLTDHEVADLVTVDTLPPGASPIGSRWVFKVKPDGTFKARLVVQGYRQRHGIDCGGTFAPVCRISSQRTLLCMAASKDFGMIGSGMFVRM
eukprot:g14220.t1